MRILASAVNLLQGEHSSRERISLLWVCVCASASFPLHTRARVSDARLVCRCCVCTGSCDVLCQLRCKCWGVSVSSAWLD